MSTASLHIVASALLLASGASAQLAPVFAQDLGSLGLQDNVATALSGDGGVVVGYRTPFHAFRWTAASGMQDIGNLGGSFGTQAYSVSSDGDTIVGDSATPSGESHAFRWVRGVGMQDLGVGGTYAYSSARDVSADGQVVVGYATIIPSFAERAFRWTQATGMVDIGTLGGGSWQARARGVSGDGAVVVGECWDNPTDFRAFRWTAAGGMIDLGVPLGGSNPVAKAASWDGSVIVGRYDEGPITRAFRWTAAGGMQRLDDLGGDWWAEATDVDAAGLVVVGSSDTPSSGNRLRAFRWTAATGAVELRGYSNQSTKAWGVSADGSAAAGLSFLFRPSPLPSSHFVRAFRWRWSTIGSSYCSAEPNSTGGPAALSIYGSLDVGFGDLALRADGLPYSSWAFALSSRDAGLSFPLPGSQGRLCLGGALGRHNGPGQVLNSHAGSPLMWVLDPAAFPSPGGPVAVQPGETWRFQVWYRDANPGATSNLTDAIAVTFQ